MNHQIMFTPNDIISLVLSVCAGIVTLSAALSIIWKMIDKAKNPEVIQNKRIEAIEDRLKQYDKYFDHDKKRLDSLEFGNEATNEALLALLNNAINPTDSKDDLKRAKKNLERYLISRKGDTNSTVI